MINVENVKSQKEYVIFVKNQCLIVGLENMLVRNLFIFTINVKKIGIIKMKLTNKEIKALKEIAQEKMLIDSLIGKGKYPYRNRYSLESPHLIPTCPNCGKEMKNAIDNITGEISKYLWECDCKDFKGKRLSVG